VSADPRYERPVRERALFLGTSRVWTEGEDWLGVRDDFRNWLIRAA
jgi:hypothetical protein